MASETEGTSASAAAAGAPIQKLTATIETDAGEALVVAREATLALERGAGSDSSGAMWSRADGLPRKRL